MEMHQVRYFLAVASVLSFTRAAEACNVSQPSLTRAIRKLEMELGGPLFRRERARTHLTELGRALLPHFERTLEAAETARALARAMEAARIAPLALGVANGIDHAGLDELLAGLVEVLPGLELTLVSGTSAALVNEAVAGRLDLLIIEAPDESPDRFEAWALFEHQYRMVVAAGHPRAGAARVALADVAGERWIDSGNAGFPLLRAAAHRAGLRLEARHRSEDVARLRRLVLAGLGTGFVPAPRDPALRAIAVAGAEVTAPVVLGAIGGRRRSLAADALVRSARARAWDQ